MLFVSSFNLCSRSVLAISALGFVALTSNPLFAAEESQSSPTFRLSAPEIFKSHRGAFALTSGDFNGDDVPDFASIDNSNSLLRVYLSQKPDDEAGDQSPWKAREILLNKSASSLVTVDWNGDKRLDLLLAQTGGEIGVLLQSKEGELEALQRVALEGEELFVGQIVGDERPDLGVVLGRRVALFPGTKDGIAPEPVAELVTAREVAFTPQIADLDGNNLPDLFYEPSDLQDEIAVFFQTGENTFSYETPLNLGGYYDWEPFIHDDKTYIASIVAPTRRIKVMEYREQTSSKEDKAPNSMSLLSFEPDREIRPESTVVGDIDGDGRPEFLSPVNGQPFLQILRFSEDGVANLQFNSTFKDCRQLELIWNAETKCFDLLVLSGEEKVIGLAQWNENLGELEFARSLPFPFEPVAMTLGGTRENPILHVALNNTTDKQFLFDSYESTRLKNLLEGRIQFLDAASSPLTLPNRDKIEALKALDLTNSGSDELVVYQEFKDPVVYESKAEGEQTKWIALTNNSLLTGLLDDTKPWQLHSMEDGKLLIQRKEFARVFSFMDGAVQIEEQILGERPAPEYVNLALGTVEGSAPKSIALINAKSGRVEFFEPSAEGALAFSHETLPLKLSLRESFLFQTDLDGDQFPEVLLLEKSKLALLQRGSREMALVSTLETTTVDGGYGELEFLPTLAGGVLATLEMREYTLDFLTLNENLELHSAYGFVMYNREARFQRRNPLEERAEPREFTLADFNNDGLTDLICLAHDKLILYYQLKPAE